MMGISGMVGISGFWEWQNVGNVKNFRNVRTDTNCHTFLKQQTGADLNDDGNFRNGSNFRNDWNVENVRNVRTYIRCHIFLETQTKDYLNDDGNFRNGWNVRKIENVRNVEKVRNVILYMIKPYHHYCAILKYVHPRIHRIFKPSCTLNSSEKEPPNYVTNESHIDKRRQNQPFKPPNKPQTSYVGH